MVLHGSREISCTLAGPAWMSFCLMFLKSGAEGKPGQGCSGQLSRHGPGVAGFHSSGGAGRRKQQWPGSDPGRSRQQ